MVKSLNRPIKKVSNKTGLKIGAKPGKTFTVQPKKIGVIAVKPVKVKTPPSYVPSAGYKGSGIQFTLPSYGQQQPGLTPNQIANAMYPGGLNPFNPTSVGQWVGANAAAGTLPEANIGGVFGDVNSFIKNVNNPETWFMVVGFLIAIIIILIALYGIVTSGQKSIIQSTIGQNASGFVNAVRPKKKGKK